MFDCPLCDKQNCLTCKAIHEGKNCQQYQADLQLQAADDEHAKQTQDMLKVIYPLTKGFHFVCWAVQMHLIANDGGKNFLSVA